MDDTLIQFITRQQHWLETNVRAAFEQHFKFPLENVKDTENLEHCVVEGCPTEFFRYRGRTFLLYDKGPIQIKREGDETVGEIEYKFLAV